MLWHGNWISIRSHLFKLIIMAAPSLSQYITDLTNGCAYLDQQVASKTTETTVYGTLKLQEAVDGIKATLALDIVSSSGTDLTAFNTSVSNAETYIATLS